MDLWMGGQRMDGCVGGWRVVEWLDGWMVGWVVVCLGGWVGSWMCEWVDVCMCG